MQQSQIKLAIFDIAGTTVQDDDQVVKAFQQAFLLKELDIPKAEILPLMGYKKPEAIRMVLDKFLNESYEDSLVEKIHDRFVHLMLEHYRTSSDVQAFPHVEDVFRALKDKGVKIALNTGFSRNIALTIIDRLQWQESGLVDYFVASDDVEIGRPHPAMIQKLMNEAGITSALDVIKIGDTEVDIREAKNAGCRYAIAVTSGAFTRAELEPYEPDYIFDDIAEVITLPELRV